jgi:rSAM/selenodomain-associated transferase 1
VDVIVLAKEPVPGRVKTRLCPPCTPAEAAALAAEALADTLAAATASGADRVVLALDGGDGRPGPWCPPGVEIVGQGTGGLDRRLATAWSAVPGPAVQVGMDTPQVTPGDLDAAMSSLEADGVDAVLGPAADGGWWAIGLRRPDARVFLGVPMSRPDTGYQQAARLASLGLRTRPLPVQTDVDTWADALHVAASSPTTRFAAAVRALTSYPEPVPATWA